MLVIVHELGHFLVARQFGIRVDEFGLGFPPRAKKLFKWKGTPFTLNWLPFGGFVKIFGENPGESDSSAHDSFQKKNRGIQSLVLVAGVTFNFLFAWLLISIGFMTGIAAPVGSDLPVENPHTVITTIIPGSPASESGLRAGDTVISLSRAGVYSELDPESLSVFISESLTPLSFEVQRGETIATKLVTPEMGIIKDKLAVGISMDSIGIVKLAPHKALWHGLKNTAKLTWMTAKAITEFIMEAVVGKADLAGITGPVGIVGMVGDVRELGFSYLLTFTAMISINLSIINLLPFPALDGGRLLFVGVEALSRRKIPSPVFNILNTAGFALLILLMILITIRDVRNIF